MDPLQNYYYSIRNENPSSLHAQKAYSAIIHATQYENDETKRRVATFLPLLFNRFPENRDKTLDALLDLCEDLSRDTRLCAIAQLPNMVKEATQYALKISDVLFQLLQQSETQSEITVVKAALTTLLRFDTRAATVVLFQQLTRGEIPRKSSLEYFHQHVIPLRSPYLVTDPELEQLVLSEIVKAFDIVTKSEAEALFSVIPKLGIYERCHPLYQQEILNVFIRYVVVATKEFDPAIEEHVKLLVDCIQMCLPLFEKKAPGSALLQFLATKVFPIEKFQKISERHQLSIVRGAAAAVMNQPNDEILKRIAPLAKELMKTYIAIPNTTPSTRPTPQVAAAIAKITYSNIEPLIYLISVAVTKDPNLSFLEDTTYHLKLKVLYIAAQQEASQRKLEAGKIGEGLYRQTLPLPNVGADPISDIARSKLETFEKLILRSENIYRYARKLLTIMKHQTSKLNKPQENGGSLTPVAVEPIPEFQPSWWNVTHLSNVMGAINSVNASAETGNSGTIKKPPSGFLGHGNVAIIEGSKNSDFPPHTNNKRKAEGGVDVPRRPSSPVAHNGPTKRARAEHPMFPPGSSREVLSSTHNHTPYLQTTQPIQAGVHTKPAKSYKAEHHSSAAPRLHILNNTVHNGAGQADVKSPSSISFVGAAKNNPSAPALPAPNSTASGISIAGAAGGTMSESAPSRRPSTRHSVSSCNPLETTAVPLQASTIQSTSISSFSTQPPTSSDSLPPTGRPSSATQSVKSNAANPTQTISERSVPAPSEKPVDDAGSTSSQKSAPEAVSGGGKMKVESRGPPRKARAIYLPPAQRGFASSISSTEQIPDWTPPALKVRATTAPVESNTNTTTFTAASPASSSSTTTTSRFPLSTSSSFENSTSGTRMQPSSSSHAPSSFPVPRSSSNFRQTEVPAVATDIQGRLSTTNNAVKGSIAGRLGRSRNSPAEGPVIGTSGLSFAGASAKSGNNRKRQRKSWSDTNSGIQTRLG